MKHATLQLIVQYAVISVLGLTLASQVLANNIFPPSSRSHTYLGGTVGQPGGINLTVMKIKEAGKGMEFSLGGLKTADTSIISAQIVRFKNIVYDDHFQINLYSGGGFLRKSYVRLQTIRTKCIEI